MVSGGSVFRMGFRVEIGLALDWIRWVEFFLALSFFSFFLRLGWFPFLTDMLRFEHHVAPAYPPVRMLTQVCPNSSGRKAGLAGRRSLRWQ